MSRINEVGSCCEQLEIVARRPAGRGLFLKVGRDELGDVVKLVFQSVDDERCLLDVKASTPVTVVQEVPIGYCPWCGAKFC